MLSPWATLWSNFNSHIVWLFGNFQKFKCTSNSKKKNFNFNRTKSKSVIKYLKFYFYEIIGLLLLTGCGSFAFEILKSHKRVYQCFFRHSMCFAWTRIDKHLKNMLNAWTGIHNFFFEFFQISKTGEHHFAENFSSKPCVLDLWLILSSNLQVR